MEIKDSPQLPPFDYLQGFKILFLNPNAGMNLLLGSLLNLIPILGPIVLLGWNCEIFQRLHRHRDPNIPKLDFVDFVHWLTRGLTPFLVSLVVLIPLLLLLFAGGVWVALILGFSLNYLKNDLTLWLSALPLAAMGFVLIFFPILVLANAALTRAYLTEDLGQALQLQKILEYSRKTWKRLLLVFLIFFPLWLALMFTGSPFLYVGIYPAMVIAHVAWVYLGWRVYEEYLAKGGEPIAVRAPQVLPSEQKSAGG